MGIENLRKTKKVRRCLSASGKVRAERKVEVACRCLRRLGSRKVELGRPIMSTKVRNRKKYGFYLLANPPYRASKRLYLSPGDSLYLSQ